MADAIIARRRSINNSSEVSGELITQIYTTNTSWEVPNAINNAFSVMIFGGGAGGQYNSYRRGGYGGGSGWMNNDTITINRGSIIQITIGNGGNGGNAGGTTSFGTYLSANGGRGASGGAGGGGYERNGNSVNGCYFYMISGGTGYQFGGGSPSGRGGPWGVVLVDIV